MPGTAYPRGRIPPAARSTRQAQAAVALACYQAIGLEAGEQPGEPAGRPAGGVRLDLGGEGGLVEPGRCGREGTHHRTAPAPVRGGERPGGPCPRWRRGRPQRLPAAAGRQRVAPRSISAELHSQARPLGMAASARRCLAAAPRPDGSAPTRERASTLATLVSTGATCWPKAKQATARAVYGPTPGRAVSPATSDGQPPRSTTAWAAARRASARRL